MEATPTPNDFFCGVPFYDPATDLLLACFLMIVGLIASLVPARHAPTIEPMSALRHE